MGVRVCVCTSGPSRSVQCQDRLHGCVRQRNIKALEHQLDGTLAVLVCAHRPLRQHHGVILTTHSQLLKGMAPDLNTKIQSEAICV